MKSLIARLKIKINLKNIENIKKALNCFFINNSFLQKSVSFFYVN